MELKNNLFEDEEFFQKDKSPVDNTQITTTLLYYSKDELKELKSLGKELLKKNFPNNYTESNLSDLILKLFRDESNKAR